jgi:hypothetical protein
MGLAEQIILSRNFWGDIPTFCSKCKLIETLKILEDEQSYTRKCGCGVAIYRAHEKDEGHQGFYFSKTFISKESFIKGHTKKTTTQKLGFQTETKNGKQILVKGAIA